MSTENTGPTTINDLFAPATPTPAPPAAPPEAPPAQTQPQPVVTAPPNPAAAETPPVATPPAQPEPPPVRQVPLSELLEERKRRQAAEEHARNYQQFFEAQRQSQQPQPQPIDPVVEPERAYAAMQAQMHNMAVNTRANTSEMIIRGQFGDAAVDKAVQAAHAANMGEYFMSRPHPYGELMNWHKSQEMAREVGNDPAAYRQKIETEVRAKVLAELKAGANPPRNLPPSLSSATNAGSSHEVVPDGKDFFHQMMAPRKRG